MSLDNDIDARDAAQAKARRTIMVFGLIACAVLIGVFFFAIRWARTHQVGDVAMIGIALVYMAGIYTVAAIANRAKARAGGVVMTRAAKRYARRIGIAVVIYGVVFLSVMVVARENPPHGPIAWLLALAPAIPLLAVLVAMGLYLREEDDEFQRALQLESAMWASLALMSVATVWGFLLQFRLVAPPPLWAAFPVWAVFLSLARGFVARRYK